MKHGTRLVAGAVGTLTALALAALPNAQAGERDGGNETAPAASAEQVLTWTADNDLNSYETAPATAVAGEATLVFENSAATGNTSGMTHTLTFDVSNSDYNNDVSVNLMASPNDANGGRVEATVTLTPGTYRYFCAIPGHINMEGELVVTEGGGGDDTTPPEVTASVAGEQNADGAYVGSATVSLEATDEGGSGVDSIEYAVDGGEFAAYTDPVPLDTPGEHTVTYRATDVAGNVSEEGSTAVTVVAPPEDDTTAPRVTPTVEGERNADGAYVGMATVSFAATDEGGSGVDRIQYNLDGAGWTRYADPFMIHDLGDHVIRYRAWDQAGNVSKARTLNLTLVAS
jgi:plastocyanin